MDHSLNRFDESTPEGKAWAMGYAQCLRDYGIYKDGVQKIGCLEKPIKPIIEQLEKSVGATPGEF